MANFLGGRFRNALQIWWVTKEWNARKVQRKHKKQHLIWKRWYNSLFYNTAGPKRNSLICCCEGLYAYYTPKINLMCLELIANISKWINRVTSTTPVKRFKTDSEMIWIAWSSGLPEGCYEWWSDEVKFVQA